MKLLLQNTRNIDGKVCSKGEHILPDEMINNWYIQALIKSKDAIVIESKGGEIKIEDAEEEKQEIKSRNHKGK